jgi:MYXO-CTERM domain-containing protein
MIQAPDYNMTKLRLTSLIAVPGLALALPLLTPSSADACGGTFCDSGPTAMPVDQTGENILFHIGENSVEAHIQIQIDPETPAEQFAWVIPVLSMPEFEVGSQLLFENMLNASVPTYGRAFTSDACADGSQNSTQLSTGGEFSDSAGGDGDGDGDPGAPEITFQGSVGAFEIAVLDGGTVEGVMTWLGENGYQQDPAAEPILASYLEQDFMFVALRLGVEAGVEDVHPIVIRYSGVEPCVPIRLTAIAAADDMEIRTFFLGDARVVPVNYRHVLVNPLKIDWLNDGVNYKEVISMAVDAQEADGNAFVTEYAGPNEIFAGNLYNEAWDPSVYAAFVDSPVGVIGQLLVQYLYYCGEGDDGFTPVCYGLHPLIEPILAEYIPVPVGLTAEDFYGDLAAHAAEIDLLAWDAVAFAAALDERIFQPGLRATELLAQNPYLTRMYTTISPSEMNADPIFRSNASLPDVENFRQATQRTLCDGSVLVTLPDGREVYFPVDVPLEWPTFQEEMPWDEDIFQENMAADAPLINLVDNTDTINALLDDFNKQRGYGDIPPGCACTVQQGGAAGSIAFGFMALGVLGLVRRRRQG